MAGGYDPINPPIRAGFYSRIQAAAEAAATGGDGGIVAFPIVGDWGPVGEFKSVTNQTQYEALYSNTENDDRFFMIGALKGNGEVGNGAKELLVYRMPLGGDIAEKTFDNDDSDPALTVAAKHAGTRGNDITITFRDNPSDGSLDQMLVYVDGALAETFSYTDDDLAALADDANENSDWVTLTVVLDGVMMTYTTGASLDDTAGTNGSAVLGDYTDALSLFESEAFNIIAIPDMTDSSILAALRTWCEEQNQNARRVMIVTGGATDESLGTALTRSGLTSTNENVVNLGYNMFIDPAGTTRRSAEMVGYVCGMIAGAGAKRSITFDRLPSGFSLSTTPTLDDINDAINGGLLIFSKDANGVKAEKGITTFTDTSDPDKPIAEFSKIKSVRTIHQIENDLTETTELEWIGKVANTDKTRDGYVGMLLSYFRRLEDENILKPGSSAVRLDETQDNTGDTLYPIYSIEIAQAIERVLAIGELA